MALVLDCKKLRYIPTSPEYRDKSGLGFRRHSTDHYADFGY